MVDLLAGRGAEDDAMCAVCGGGDSNKDAGNEIVFCERCDVAVHQECYGVDIIPAGARLSSFCPSLPVPKMSVHKSTALVVD